MKWTNFKKNTTYQKPTQEEIEPEQFYNNWKM